MSFDPLVTNAGRLRILTALAVEERQEFVRLREATQLTDGNLASHARRLQDGGLIAIDKQFRDGKPVTHLMLTPHGRKALESHARRLMAAISQRRLRPVQPALNEPECSASAPVIALAPPRTTADEEWVD